MPADAPTSPLAPASSSTEPAPPATPTSRMVLAGARRSWRRAGVGREDRAALADELAGEVEAASADGYPLRAVLGEDPAATARGWAEERGLAGRSLQVPTMLAVVVGGVLLGSSTFLVELGVTLGGRSGGDDLTPGLVTLAILVSGVVMSVLLPVLGTWAVLHHRGDPRAGATARWLAVLLPLGGMAGALLAVVLGAALQDHEGDRLAGHDARPAERLRGRRPAGPPHRHALGPDPPLNPAWMVSGARRSPAPRPARRRPPRASRRGGHRPCPPAHAGPGW